MYHGWSGVLLHGVTATMTTTMVRPRVIWPPAGTARLRRPPVEEGTVTRVRRGVGHTDAPATVWSRATADFDRWLSGDSAALDELVATMTPVLWQIARSYRLTQEQAEDVVQTTWLSFVRKHSSILDTAAVGAWLTLTTRREAWRVAKRSGRDVPVDDEALESRVPTQRSAESLVVEGDRNSRVWAAVESLPERCRRLLRVVAFDHRPDYSGLAEELGMPIGSIGPTRGRCLGKLRDALLDEGEVS
ncbi:RNA polymerase sigma factor (sigma-70 family) [Nocardioides albertanoniae]|uniref:RNA polymerase sigma factor (Sigma-70 family) n=1 Tax=Nocardioides albertanoniae TaxID=1175486 RepID=A0A543A1B0_9ACTN|nr:RNA polymerase sigma factor (sigma-70 family) [Nocardioides albertanoniae]